MDKEQVRPRDWRKDGLGAREVTSGFKCTHCHSELEIGQRTRPVRMPNGIAGLVHEDECYTPYLAKEKSGRVVFNTITDVFRESLENVLEDMVRTEKFDAGEVVANTLIAAIPVSAFATSLDGRVERYKLLGLPITTLGYEKMGVIPLLTDVFYALSVGIGSSIGAGSSTALGFAACLLAFRAFLQNLHGYVGIKYRPTKSQMIAVLERAEDDYRTKGYDVFEIFPKTRIASDFLVERGYRFQEPPNHKTAEGYRLIKGLTERGIAYVTKQELPIEKKPIAKDVLKE